MAKSRNGGEQDGGGKFDVGPGAGPEVHSIEEWGWPSAADNPVDIVQAMRLRRRYEAAHPEEPNVEVEDLVEPLNVAYGGLLSIDYAEQAAWVREEYARAEAEGRDVIPEAAIPDIPPGQSEN